MTKTINDWATRLATGIISQTAIDYVESLKQRYREIDSDKAPSEETVNMMNDCLDFFRGDEIKKLNPDFDVEEFIKKLRIVAAKQYYKELKTGQVVVNYNKLII